MKRYIRSSSLDKMYKGIWYGANKVPMTVRELLDKIIERSGRGFNIKTKYSSSSDRLLDDATKIVYLTDEENRGKLTLDPDSIHYLLANLPEDSYLYIKLYNI